MGLSRGPLGSRFLRGGAFERRNVVQGHVPKSSATFARAQRKSRAAARAALTAAARPACGAAARPVSCLRELEAAQAASGPGGGGGNTREKRQYQDSGTWVTFIDLFF